ncbi:MAG: hypothetical protein JSR58_06595 [Verrucomicrobia bacterium]|nr:hypothetical protein [Verrucomicrobiota bacterium]
MTRPLSLFDLSQTDFPLPLNEEQRIIALIRKNKIGSALEILSNKLDNNPSPDINLLALRAAAHCRNQKPYPALLDVIRALELDPRNPKLLKAQENIHKAAFSTTKRKP